MVITMEYKYFYRNNHKEWRSDNKMTCRAQPKIMFYSQIIFVCHIGTNISGFFHLCLHWASVVHVQRTGNKIHILVCQSFHKIFLEFQYFWSMIQKLKSGFTLRKDLCLAHQIEHRNYESCVWRKNNNKQTNKTCNTCSSCQKIHETLEWYSQTWQ